MSVTGAWVIGAVSDAAIAEVLDAVGQAVPPVPPQEYAPEELAWWRGLGRRSLFTAAPGGGGWRPEDDAYRLGDLFDACGGPAGEEALGDALMDRFPPHEDGLFVATARKASPFSALAYALGPDAVLQLPGRFGDFLLDAAGVRARLPAAEAALTLTGARRREAAERIGAWLTGLGDDSLLDAGALIDGPLRVLRHAAGAGLGAAGSVRWY